MQSSQWPSCFTSLPRTLIFNCMVQRNEPSGKELYNLIQERFRVENTKLIAMDPSFSAVYRKGEDENTVSPIKIFQRLMNRLHDKAEGLGIVNYKMPMNLPKKERIEWEWENHENLMAEVIARETNKEIIFKEYTEMLKELQSYENTNYIVDGFEAIYQRLNKECFLGNIQNKKDLLNNISIAMGTILFHYDMIKKAGKLGDFFDTYNDPCYYLHNDVFAILEELRTYTFTLKLDDSIHPKFTKEKNMEKLVRFFTSFQEQKYKKDRDLWGEDYFEINYNTKENFIEFLEERKIIGMQTSDGPITQKDIEDYAEMYRRQCILERYSDNDTDII